VTPANGPTAVSRGCTAIEAPAHYQHYASSSLAAHLRIAGAAGVATGGLLAGLLNGLLPAVFFVPGAVTGLLPAAFLAPGAVTGAALGVGLGVARASLLLLPLLSDGNSLPRGADGVLLGGCLDSLLKSCLSISSRDSLGALRRSGGSGSEGSSSCLGLLLLLSSSLSSGARRLSPGA
jgi:hypothetical protein